MSNARLVYEGSVKNLWQVSTEELEFEYTDAYSVFDWGRMPESLSYKGESLAALGAYFFEALSRQETWKGVQSSAWLKPIKGRLRERVEAELEQLEQSGLNHHFLGRPSPNRLRVKRVEIISPIVRKLAGQTLYHYELDATARKLPSRLIPLEVVFRFGMPKGSSLVERLDENYAQALGLESVPKEGQYFDRPVVEFFSKLEDTDRFLTWEQALNYSGLPYEYFEQLLARSHALAVWLHAVFEEKGIALWDGKFEWALLEGKLALVDSIGPDELRLLDPATGAQISKEFLRQFYRPTKWFEAVKKAKLLAAADPAQDWKTQVLKEAGEPPHLSEPYRIAAEALYPSLALALTGENPGGKGVPMRELFERINACLGE